MLIVNDFAWQQTFVEQQHRHQHHHQPIKTFTWFFYRAPLLCAHFSTSLCCGSLGHISIFGQVDWGGMSLLVNFCGPNCLIIKCHSSLWRLPNWQRPQKGVKIADCHHLAGRHTPTSRAIWNLAKTGGHAVYMYIYMCVYLLVFWGGFTRCQNSWCLADYVSWRCSRCYCYCNAWKLLLIFHWTFFRFRRFSYCVFARGFHSNYELFSCVWDLFENDVEIVAGAHCCCCCIWFRFCYALFNFINAQSVFSHRRAIGAERIRVRIFPIPIRTRLACQQLPIQRISWLHRSV